MSKRGDIQWNRLTIEAIAIVGSILLAFAIDAWWEERVERQAEIALLQRLHADFIEIQSGLEVVLDEHLRAREACLAVLNYPIGATLPSTPEMDTMIALMFLNSRTFNPGTGAIASFLSSEGQQLIQNQELADRLLGWSGLVEELQEEEASLQKGVAERWTPFLASRVNLGPYIFPYGIVAPSVPEHVASPQPRKPLAVDTELVNHVLDRLRWQQIAIRDIEPVRTAIAEILALTEQELGR